MNQEGDEDGEDIPAEDLKRGRSFARGGIQGETKDTDRGEVHDEERHLHHHVEEAGEETPHDAGVLRAFAVFCDPDEDADQQREEDHRQHVAFGGRGERVLRNQALELLPKDDTDAARRLDQQRRGGCTLFEQRKLGTLAGTG